MKNLLRTMTPTDRAELAQKAGRSVGYFYQIAGGHRKPSAVLSKQLVLIEPRLTLHELRPDIWSVT